MRVKMIRKMISAITAAVIAATTTSGMVSAIPRKGSENVNNESGKSTGMSGSTNCSSKKDSSFLTILKQYECFAPQKSRIGLKKGLNQSTMLKKYGCFSPEQSGIGLKKGSSRLTMLKKYECFAPEKFGLKKAPSQSTILKKYERFSSEKKEDSLKMINKKVDWSCQNEDENVKLEIKPKLKLKIKPEIKQNRKSRIRDLQIKDPRSRNVRKRSWLDNPWRKVAPCIYFNGESVDVMSLSKECVAGKSAKAHIAQKIKFLISKKWLIECSKGEILEVVGILSNCLSGSEAAREVSGAINELACGQYLDEFSKDEILKVIKILSACSIYTGSEKYVATAVSNLSCKGFFNDFSEDEKLKIIGFLKNCLASDVAKTQISTVILNFISKMPKDYKYPTEEIEKMTDILAVCSEGDDDLARQRALAGIFNLAQVGLLGQHSKEHMLKVTDALVRSIYERRLSPAAIELVGELAARHALDEYGVCDVLKITETLLEFAKNVEEYEAAVPAIKNLASANLFRDYEESDLLQLTNFFIHCAEYECMSKEVLEAINAFAGNDLFAKYSYKNMNKIFDLLFKLSKVQDVSEKVSIVIMNFQTRNLTKGYQKKVAEILDICAEGRVVQTSAGANASEVSVKCNVDESSKDELLKMTAVLSSHIKDENLGLGFWDAVNGLIDDNALRRCSKGEAVEIVELLNRFANFKNNDVKQYIYVYIANILLKMTSQNFLDEFDKSQILKIVDLLKKCSVDEEAKPAVAQTIAVLAARGSLNKFFKPEISKVIDVLDKCSTHTLAKKEVAKAISQLGLCGFFSAYEHSDVYQIIQLLYKCTGVGHAEEYIAEASSILASSNFLTLSSKNKVRQLCRKNEVIQLVNLLSICSNNPDAAENILIAIENLAYKDLFSQFTEDEMQSIASLLGKCSNYEFSQQYIDGIQKKLNRVLV